MSEQAIIQDLCTPATKGDLALTEAELTSTIETSFETFAGMVKQGFDDMGKRFDGIEGHIQRIDNRLARHQDVIDTSKLHIATLDTRVVAIERKVGLPAKPLQA